MGELVLEFALPARLVEAVNRHAIDTVTGEQFQIPGKFVPEESFSDLKFRLLNVKDERELAAFLSRCGYVPLEKRDQLKGRPLPPDRRIEWDPARHITRAVSTIWFGLRDNLREVPPPWMKTKTSDTIFMKEFIEGEGLSFVPDLHYPTGRLTLRVQASDPLSAIILADRIDELLGLGVVRCGSRTCGKFFPMPVGQGHRKGYCRDKLNAEGRSACYEREKKRRAKSRDRKKWLRWARAGKAIWDRLPVEEKKERAHERSRFIAEQAHIISRKKKPPFRANWVTQNLFNKKKGASR